MTKECVDCIWHYIECGLEKKRSAEECETFIEMPEAMNWRKKKSKS